ncbi:MAG: Ig-like domain-containing protein, partial [Brevundimonas sp.]|uniref:Ig-like domain-containing protein n=1 Tax=Brevundimonas sp. TaxID=1871086 RepID=UPI002733631A
VTLAGGATVTRNANGTLTYAAPSTQTGAVTFTYTVSDGTLLATGLVSLTVQAAGNASPVAQNDVAGTVTAGQSLVIHALVNDHDPEGAALTITHVDGQAVASGASVTLSGGGVVTRNANGTLTYTAPSGQTGAVTFAYTVSDGTASANASVSLTVIAASGGGGGYTASDVIFTDTFSTTYQTGTYSQSGVTYATTSEQAQSGSSSVKVTLNQWAQGGIYAERTITSGVNSVLQFWIRRESSAWDGGLMLRHGSGWSEMNLNSSNNQHWSIDGVTGKTGLSDLQAGTWHKVEVDLAALGVTQLKAMVWKTGGANGAVVYMDTVSLGSIGSGGSVNQAPVVANDAAGNVTAGQSLVISPLTNDSDPDSDPLTITHINGQAVSSGGSVTLAGGATVTRNANGTLTYAAPSTQTGAVTFTYTVSDGTLLATGLVS